MQEVENFQVQANTGISLGGEGRFILSRTQKSPSFLWKRLEKLLPDLKGYKQL